MKSRMLRYAVELMIFVLFFLAIFVAYHMKSEPTKFIYYNF